MKYCFEPKSQFFDYDDLKVEIEKLESDSKYELLEIGKSFEGRSIFQIKIGKGSKNILVWSQMHGNEPTGTLSIFELLSHFQEELNGLFEELSIYFIPILNPDGAQVYKRECPNGIDLNRDAKSRQTPEMNLLFSQIEKIKPDYLFNLHNQRTIFNVSGTKTPALLSFLSPSYNYAREINDCRLKTMEVINKMCQSLNTEINGEIGRYTDEFYPSATGDNLHALGYPCILIESGNTYNDPEKEKVRKYTTLSILYGLQAVSKGISTAKKEEIIGKYESIPQNDSKLRDIIIRNVIYKPTNNYEFRIDIALQKKITRKSGEYINQYFIDRIGDLAEFYGYEEIDGTEMLIQNNLAEIMAKDSPIIDLKTLSL